MTARPTTVLSAGMINCDIYFKDIPDNVMKIDTTFMHDFLMRVGGDAANMSMNLAKLGVKVSVVGRTHDDVFGSTALSLLEEAGADTHFVYRDSEKTSATSLFWFDKRGVNHRTSYWGANETFYPSHITDEMLKSADCLFIGSLVTLTGFKPRETGELLKKAKSLGLFVAADMSGGRVPDAELFREALPHCDIFSMNEPEMKDLCGTTDPYEALEFLRPFRPAIVAIKLGARGALISDFENNTFIVPSFADNLVDFVGAGDAFMSAFLAARLRGMELRPSAAAASMASALCLKEHGASTWGIPFDELNEKAVRRAGELSFTL